MGLLNTLTSRRLLAIVRGDDAHLALECIQVLVEEAIDLVEVSLTGRDALTVITEARRSLGESVELGAGTVLTADDAQRAVDAGASYLVTPCLGAGADEAVRLGVPVLMGALSPTEVTQAVDGGATAVKLFPAELGGPSYLRALRAPFPHVPFVPVGGIDATTARQFLDSGAVAVGVGSPLLGDAARQSDLDGLRARARDLRRAVAPLVQEHT